METINSTMPPEDTRSSISAEPVTRQKVVNSVKWTAIEKYSSQGIQFIVSIIMARLLTTAEYGIIGIISVFLSFSSMLIDSGLERALIHKKNCTAIDFSTANVTNIIFSLMCYMILFFCAPFIADFYGMPIITPTLRVMSLTFIFGAVAGVSRTILTKELAFKRLSLITLTTSILSGIIGITMAYLGMGVWALVLQAVLATLFSSICVIIVAKYKLSFRFSRSSFKELFGFGSKMLGSDFIWVLFTNIHPMLIGKVFNAQSVGYYNRATAYSDLLPNNLSGILGKVLFPVFSTLQDDEQRLERLYTKALTVTSAIIFSGNFFLMGLAYPLILNMISEKWLPCVPLLQILCIARLINHINAINGRVLIAKGFPGVFLKMTSVTLPLTLIIILISINFGLIALAWGSVISSLTGTVYCCYVFKKYSGINPWKSLRGTIQILFISGPIGLGALLLFKYILAPSLLNLLIVGISMTLVYILALRLLCPQILEELIYLVKRKR